MDAIEKTSSLFLKPFNSANIQKTINKPTKATCFDSINARFTFVAQIISSMIAIPMIILVGLIFTLMNLFRCNNNKATCFQLKEGLKRHALVTIPVSFLGIFIPLSSTKMLRDSLNACLIN